MVSDATEVAARGIAGLLELGSNGFIYHRYAFTFVFSAIWLRGGGTRFWVIVHDMRSHTLINELRGAQTSVLFVTHVLITLYIPLENSFRSLVN